MLLVHVKAPVLFCSLNILRSKNKVSRKCIQVIIDYLRWGTHEKKKKRKEKKGKKKTTKHSTEALVASLFTNSGERKIHK